MEKIKFLFVALFVGGLSFATQAGTLTITDGNASATVLTESGQEEGVIGMNSWVIDGVDMLHQQWFWFRVQGESNEQSIDNLNLAGEMTIDTNGLTTGDFSDDKAVIGYIDPFGRFTIEVEFELTGGANGSGVSSIVELISITNLDEQNTLDMSFFQYSDFDLNGTAGDDLVMIDNGNTANQSDASGAVSETVVTPEPSAHQADVFSIIRDMLNDQSADNLNDTVNTNVGDATWAFQWDITLNPAGTQGSNYLISKVKNINAIPEPASFAILGLGALLMTRRRQNA